MGCICKFFGFSISHTIFNLPLSILYLPHILLIPCTFSPILPANPPDNPPNDLHTYDSVPVLVVCLVCFCFCFLDLVVDSCEFVVILMFIVLMNFFLDIQILNQFRVSLNLIVHYPCKFICQCNLNRSFVFSLIFPLPIELRLTISHLECHFPSGFCILDKIYSFILFPSCLSYLFSLFFNFCRSYLKKLWF